MQEGCSLPKEEDGSNDWDEVEWESQNVSDNVVLTISSYTALYQDQQLTVLNLARGFEISAPSCLVLPPFEVT